MKISNRSSAVFESGKAALCLGSVFAAATPAQAIDPGCYPAEVVRAATWNAEGADKQYTVIVGDRNTDTRNRNFFTSNADGSIGYNIENNGTGANDGDLCIAAKYKDIKLNRSTSRPSWAAFPDGSDNDRYIQAQERDENIRIIFGATALVRGNDGREYIGPQLFVTKAGNMIAGMEVGAVFTNNRLGAGDTLMELVNLKTNANFDALALRGR